MGCMQAKGRSQQRTHCCAGSSCPGAPHLLIELRLQRLHLEQEEVIVHSRHEHCAQHMAPHPSLLLLLWLPLLL
jgi:hypothetical protein